MTFARHRWTPLKTIVAMLCLALGFVALPIGFKSCARSVIVESQAPVWTALRDLSEFQDTAALELASKKELIDIIQDLSAAQAGLELKLKSTAALEEEKARLEGLLKMPPYWGYEARVARIIRRDLNGWWQQIWIDRGSASGIRPGLGVVCRDGVVGRVREVYEQTSVVELITSPRFRMAAKFVGDSRPFVYSGMGLRFGMAPIGSVTAVQPENALAADTERAVVTTGLSGSFPEGLPIGSLYKTDTQSAGGLLEGRVRLSVSLDSLREVTVLMPNR